MRPGRSKGGQRLYTDEDLARLSVLARAVRLGRRIGDVAGLPPAELEALVREDELAAGTVPSPRATGGRNASADTYLQQAIAAVEDLDDPGLDRVLSHAAVALSPPRLRNDVLVPLLETVGERWRRGDLRIAHEHLASALVRSLLGSLRNGQHLPESAPQLVVTTPSGQIHELGALMAGSIASEAGWRVVYLGANLPAEDIAAAVQQRTAQAVALSIVYPLGDANVHEELRKLRRYLGDGHPILIGGQGAPSYADVLEEIDAERIDTLDMLPDLLDRLARADS